MKTIILIFAALSAQFSIASTDTHHYRCTSYMVNGEKNTKEIMLLSISQQEAVGDIINQSWDDKLIGGSLNVKYKSRGQFNYLKFGNLIIEEDLLIGGRQLNDGSLGGVVRFEAEIEGGFTQYKFICNRSF